MMTMLRRLFLVVAGLCLLSPLSPAAAQVDFEVLLDLDNDLGTGCTVATVDGTFSGVEQRLITQVSAAMGGLEVTSVSLADCVSGSSFGAPAPVACAAPSLPYPVGTGLGSNGADVIETCYPLPASPPAPQLRLGVIAGDQGGGGDALLSTDGTSAGDDLLVLLASILEIPTLSQWGLLFLAALLGLAALRLLRQRQGVAVGLLACLLLTGAVGVAWAAIVLDGQPGDWMGSAPLGMDAPAMGVENPDLVAVFARVEGATLFFRIDAAGNTAPNAGDDAYNATEDTVLNLAAPGVLGNDMDPEGAMLTAVNASALMPMAAGSLALNPDGSFTYTPAADFFGVATFTYQADDGVVLSMAATVTITVAGVNDPPAKSGTVNPAGFVEDGGAVSVFASVSVSDIDDTDLESATITLTNRPDGMAESLAVNTAGTSITASAYNPATGVISLSGTDTLANYQSVIASLSYDNTSDTPDTADRTISCLVNDGDDDSPTASVMLGVAAANDPPAKSGTVNAAGWVEGGGAVNVYASVSVSDPDDTDLESATITLTNRPDGAAESLAVNTGGTSITASAYSSATGVISLSGTDTLANYQAVIASLTYDNSDLDADETPRTISCVVNDGDADSPTVSVMLPVDEINTPPMLTSAVIAYNAVGNTLLRVDGPDADGHDTPLPGRVASTTDATDAFAAAGPSDPDTPAAMLGYVPGAFPTMLGGAVTLDDDGDFFYVPPVGVEGADSVMLTFTDGEGGNVPVTLNLTVAAMVWYVEDTVDGSKNPAAGGPGNSLDPFETLAAAEAASGPNHYILVFETDAPLDQSIALKSGQKLYGQPVEDVLPALLPGGLLLEEIADTDARPVINRSMGDAVTVLANAVNGDRPGIEIRHLQLTGDDNAIDVSAADANNLDIALTDNVLASVNGPSLLVSGVGSTGVVTVRELAGTDVTVAGMGGGHIFETVTFDRIPGGAFDAVQAGNVDVGNPASPGDVTGPGVRLNNVRGVLDYGTLNIGNTAGAGLFVRDAGGKAGTFVLDTDGGTIHTVNGPAVDLDPVGLGLGGMDGMVLNSVTANVTAGLTPYGINLHTVAGSFQVTGATSLSSSGGGMLTTGIAATDATAAITFTGATTISNTAGAGIGMSNVDGDFTVASMMSSITGAGGPAIDIDQGLGDFTYNGSIINTAGRSVEITNHEGPGGGSTIALTGAITDSGMGIFLDNNDQGAGGTVLNLTGALNLTTGASNAFTATNGGVVNVTDPANNNLAATTTGTGVTITDTTIGGSGVKFTTVNVGDANPAAPNAANGILLTNVPAGSFTVTGGAIQNVTSRGLDVAGGSGDVTVGASISTTATGRSLEVTGKMGGTVAQSGAIDDNGLGVHLDSNTGSTINVTGSMDIDTVGANTGFNATGGGTVNVMTGSNDVNTSAGTGLGINIANTTIGASGVAFRSVRVTGAPSGIVLTNTGTSGGLQIQGDGTDTLGGNDSGGVLLSTTGDAVVATGTRDLRIANLRIASPGGDGFDIDQLAGTASRLDNVTVRDADVANTSAVRINQNGQSFNLTVDRSVFDDCDTGQVVFLTELEGAHTSQLDIEDSEFSGLDADAVSVVGSLAGAAADTGTITHNFRRNTVRDSDTDGVSVTNFSCGGQAVCIFNIEDNVIRNLAKLGNFNGGLVNLGYSGLPVSGGSFSATVSGNRVEATDAASTDHRRGINVILEPSAGTVPSFTVNVDDNDVNDMGDREALYLSIRSAVTAANVKVTNNRFGTGTFGTTAGNIGGTRDCVFVETTNTASITLNMLMEDNIIQCDNNLSDSTLDVDARDGSRINLTMRGNAISSSGTATAFIDAGPFADTGIICLDLNAANVGADANSANPDFELEQTAGTFHVEGMGAGPNNAAAVEAFLDPRNNNDVTAIGTGFTNNGGAGCPEPP